VGDLTMRRARLVVVACVLAPAPALAHVVVDGVGGFTGGLLHPMLVPTHVLALLAFGLFVGQQRRRLVPLVVFAVSLVTGLVAIALATGETAASTVLLAATVLAGLSVALAWSPPVVVGSLLAAVIGAALALDSPPQAVTLQEGNLMLAGTASGALLLVLMAAAASSVATHHVAKIAVRVVGSWITASALLVLAVMLVR
jgi:urease accessory protein